MSGRTSCCAVFEVEVAVEVVKVDNFRLGKVVGNHAKAMLRQRIHFC